MVSSTRKSTRLSSKAVAVLPESTAPSPTPAKKETTKKKKTKKESVTKAASTATKSKKKKETVAVIAKAKKAVAKKVVAPTAVKKAAAAAVVGSEGKKIVIIEACKQWGAFKSRANKILKAVGDKATVQINLEKPGKGNFIVSVEGIDEPIVSLLAMKRPFPTLKALDMDEINEKVISALS